MPHPNLPLSLFSSFGFQFTDPFISKFATPPSLKSTAHTHTHTLPSIYSLFLLVSHLYINHPFISTFHLFSNIFSYIHNSTYSIIVFRMSCRPGDWNCRSCQHMNFQRRESCQRCGESKYGEYVGGRSGGSSFGLMSNIGSDVRPGDWYCAASNCGAHNFASRSSCFKCGAFKDDSSSSSFNNDFLLRSRPFASAPTRPSWKSGDWICNRSGCNEHNFASRMECFKCSAPRDTY